MGKKQTCWRLYPFSVIDRQGPQEYLNRMAQNGWELVHISFSLFARFQRTERTDLTYFLDWADPPREENQDYIQLCADAGWELVQGIGYGSLYASLPGAHPVPIQTDPELDYQRFRQRVLRRLLLSGGSLLLIFGLLFAALLANPSVLTSFLLSRNIIWFVLLFPLWALLGGCYLLFWNRRMLSWRRALSEGESLPGLRPGTRWLLGALHLLRGVACILLLVLLPIDFAFNGSGTIDLGRIIGALVAAFLIGNSKSKKKSPAAHRQEERAVWGYVLIAALLVACENLSGPLRAEYPGRLPYGPLAPAHEMWSSGSAARIPRGDTLFGSQANWWEAEDGFHPDASYQVTASLWTYPALADWALGIESRGMSPVEGRQDLYTDGESLLLVRGQARLRIVYHGSGDPGPALEAILPDAVTWLEGVK